MPLASGDKTPAWFSESSCGSNFPFLFKLDFNAKKLRFETVNSSRDNTSGVEIKVYGCR